MRISKRKAKLDAIAKICSHQMKHHGKKKISRKKSKTSKYTNIQVDVSNVASESFSSEFEDLLDSLNPIPIMSYPEIGLPNIKDIAKLYDNCSVPLWAAKQLYDISIVLANESI